MTSASSSATRVISKDGRDIRVEDYLNDQLQTSADLENIDNLLVNVIQQHSLLKQQLQEAENDLERATGGSETHTADLQRHANAFEKQQADIDLRLRIVTQSETSDDAVRKFDANMDKLRRLEVASGYMELLAEVDSLSSEARKNFKVSPQAALRPYLRLQNLAFALREAQPAAEDAAPHLVDHVDGSVRTLWRQMKDAFANDFEKTLKKMKWPAKDVTLSEELELEWTAGVEQLLELQEPELKAQDSTSGADSSQVESLVLLPLEVMVKPLELGFKYHFEGDKPSNRMDKPELLFSYVVRLLNNYDGFFVTYLQPILRKHFQHSNLALTSIYIDSTSAFITALLPMLRRKILASLPQVTKQPHLLSHFIHELIDFDVTITDEWGYDAGNSVEGWRGLAWEVLVKQARFGAWLDVEKTFALSRYQAIIDEKGSGEIDYDSVDASATKPTSAAIRVNDLLETITDRYRPLSSFSQKLRFLIDIQIAIFDKFHSRLHGSLEAYLSITSSLVRTVQGVSNEDQADLQGVGGLERLCRIYGSAEYLEGKMRDWSDDVFFLELWDELQDRARRNSSGKGLAGPMSVEDVADRTSSAVGSEEDKGALFDETAGAYRRLRVRTEGFIQDMLIQNSREALRAYGRINPWSSLASEASEKSASLALTAELDANIQQLDEHLIFLSKVLSPAPLRRIGRQLALSLQSFFWESILMRHPFSSSGAAQFIRDVTVVWEVMDRYLGPGQAEMGMRKLRDGLVLLGLESVSGDGRKLEAGGNLDLVDVEKKLFESNESGREVLEDLGLEIISETEARHVLERRIELGT